MLSTRYRATCAVIAAAALLTGCSSGGRGKATSVAPAPSAEQAAPQSGDTPIGVSPGGVTTRIDEPAQSTEEQYAQACLSAKEWMDAKGGDPHNLVEPYLKEVQSSADAGRATFMKTWKELSGPQQAGVIIAVKAAADGGC
ncbi:MAG: lipoprotein LpqV [Mycobacterium sp.]